jgi:hypothetical protein
MCPVCIAAAAIFAGKTASASGLSAIAIRKFGIKNAAPHQPATSPIRISSDIQMKEDHHG